jgi:WD40 repeat protein
MGNAHTVRGMRLQAILTGHTGFVTDVSLSPDGRHLASVADDQTVRLWSISSGAEVAKFDFSGSATKVQWSPDGTRIAWASGQAVCMREIGGGARTDLRPSAPPLAWNIRALAWSPDGAQLACGITDVHIWDASSGREQTVKGNSAWISALIWSSDGRFIAGETTSNRKDSNSLRVWDAASKRQKICMNSYSVNSLAWLHSGALIAAGCDDGAIRVWNPSTGDLTRSLEGSVGQVWGLSASVERNVFASRAGSLKLWRSDTWEILTSLSREASDGPACLHGTQALLATAVNHRRQILVWTIDFESLIAAESAPMIHYTTARIALVGDSGVGKTGLGWRIAHGQFKEHTSTHGQQFWVVDALGLRRADGCADEPSGLVLSKPAILRQHTQIT